MSILANHDAQVYQLNKRKTEYYIQIHIDLLCNIYIYIYYHRYYDYDHHHHHHHYYYYYYYYSHDLNFSMFHLSYKFFPLA